jgi:trk system potassium uptake protein TrkH
MVVSLCMAFPMIWAGIDGTEDLTAFAAAMTCGLSLGAACCALTGGKKADYERLGVREAFVVVGLSWVISGVIGALPYAFSGALPSFTDAFFEAVSGLTTTGATVFTDVEALPRGLLFWRSMTHWMGGMGIVVLSLAVLPFLGVGGIELYKAEVPGPTPEKLTPRVQQTALSLWGVYVLLTALQTILLTFGGMSFFEAVTHAFGTISTGGFSTRNASIAAFGSPYIEWVVTFFMFASGANFSLHFMILTGFWRKALRDEEFRLYAAGFAGAAALIAAILWLGGTFGAERSLRAAAFQVGSFMTTTGFASENYTLWPHFSQFLLLLLAFAGGCAGSTSGGLKCVRLLVLLRSIEMEIRSFLHPRAVLRTKVNGTVVSVRAMRAVLAFFTLYVAVMLAASLAVTALGGNRLDISTALSGIAASLTNLGSGLGKLGATDSYAWLPAAVKWVFCFCMLVGRLELYAILLLFHPRVWKR